MEKRILIIAVHGFLGLPEDWSFLKDNLKSNYTLITPSLFNFNHKSSLNFTPELDFHKWNKQFELFLQAQRKLYNEIILVGYSLGGRLLLNTIFNKPDLWDHAHLFSVNPGIFNEEEQIKRMESDNQWAKKFLCLPWNELMSAWNAQPVFKNDIEPQRFEKSYQKELLTLALRNWSLSKQSNYWVNIANQKKVVHWWTGENDLKFQSIGQELHNRNNLNQHHIIKNVGHRLIFSYDFQSQFIMHTLNCDS